MTATINPTCSVMTKVGRILTGLFGGQGRPSKASRRASRPAFDDLEERKVLTLSALGNAVAAVEAARVAGPMLAQLEQVSTRYGSNVAISLAKLELSAPVLTSFLKHENLGALAAVPGAAAVLANDIISDMAYLYQHSKPTASIPTTTANATANLNYYTSLNNLASYDWGGNTSLSATALAGVAPVGFNKLEAQAGLAGWKIPGVNI